MTKLYDNPPMGSLGVSCRRTNPRATILACSLGTTPSAQKIAHSSTQCALHRSVEINVDTRIRIPRPCESLLLNGHAIPHGCEVPAPLVTRACHDHVNRFFSMDTRYHTDVRCQSRPGFAPHSDVRCQKRSGFAIHSNVRCAWHIERASARIAFDTKLH